MNLQTPLARVRGLGSAKHGAQHWWQQRLTAIALVPLCLWFIISIASLDMAQHAVISQWMRSPFNAILLILFIISLFHHAQLGIQVVIEDYIDSEWQKIACIVIIKFITAVTGLASVMAVLKVFLGL